MKKFMYYASAVRLCSTTCNRESKERKRERQLMLIDMLNRYC